MLRPSALVLALVISGHSLWLALQGQLSVTTALIWFLVAVPISALVVNGLSSLTSGYRRSAALQKAKARASAPSETPPGS